MTRKDYINLSNAIRATNDRIEAGFRDAQVWGDAGMRKQEQLRGVRRAAAHIADALKADNPRFDQARFLTECGYGGEVRATQPASQIIDGEGEVREPVARFERPVDVNRY